MDGQISTTRRRGRPPRYLLSAIAVCGVCGAATRVGAQNTGGGKHQPSHYRVYECAGAPGRTGFHVSMRQEHLDEIVTDAVLARILGPDFRVPRAREEDEDGSEQRALRLEIKGHRAWLEAVRKEARRRGRPRVLAAQERIVRLKIEAAQARIDELERLNPLVDELRRSQRVRDTWSGMSLIQQRHVIESLMVPRIHPVEPAERGQRGPNARRVDLVWRDPDPCQAR